ncbi:hypothetical protein BCIN_03g00740 [Botrytis cinerea B05.10]|uniref:DUF7924 domain-containing protein n=1 Tax=Botryotinia fuckeliana (strain B05.10) TaxID=332648 RepID=A0A384JBA0_BOTFB|nr:hypothetical protein BCIN_03g00740 [Botrytis cinerea B05.10]ATZ47770.1 hypothetical protein BCIN_03g00740 [Botrytis cinerea B05.10]
MSSFSTLPYPVDMPPHQAKPDTRNVGQPSLQKDQGKTPQGIKRKRSHPPSRKSAQACPERAVSKDRNTKLKHPLSSTTNDTVVGSSGKNTNPLEYWAKEFRWPKEYFEPETNINNLLVKKKSSYLHEENSEASTATPSDQKPREVRSTPYMHPGYEIVLLAKGSFMGPFELGITDESEGLSETLLTAEQSIPQDTLFGDDLFVKICEGVKSRNEARVIRDISPLICPSAQILSFYDAKHLTLLNESVNEGWNNAVSFYGSRPQPDYSVGFDRFAFTDEQFQKLKPFVGEVADIVTSHFMATWQMYFPFLACEVKCGAAALDIADRQNAHSMTIAVRGIVELFRLGKREKELHREILGFSLSHNDQIVRIYGHYPVIDGKKTTFYRHPIREFSFTERNGKEKWTAYKFTKNVYDIWMPNHLKRICSVIDSLPPNIGFEVGESGLSQGLENYQFSGYSNQGAESLPEEASSQASRISSREITCL